MSRQTGLSISLIAKDLRVGVAMPKHWPADFSDGLPLGFRMSALFANHVFCRVNRNDRNRQNEPSGCTDSKLFKLTWLKSIEQLTCNFGGNSLLLLKFQNRV